MEIRLKRKEGCTLIFWFLQIPKWRQYAYVITHHVTMGQEKAEISPFARARSRMFAGRADKRRTIPFLTGEHTEITTENDKKKDKISRRKLITIKNSSTENCPTPSPRHKNKLPPVVAGSLNVFSFPTHYTSDI